MQPLAHRVLHAHAELLSDPQDPRQVQPGRADPPVQVAALDQFEHDVRTRVDDLDRVRPNDVRMIAQLRPEPALGGEPADPDGASQQLAAQSLESHHLTAGLAQVVVDHVDQAHAPFVDVEDLESITDPVSDRDETRHEGSLLPHSLVNSLCAHTTRMDAPLSSIRDDQSVGSLLLISLSATAPEYWAQEIARGSR